MNVQMFIYLYRSMLNKAIAKHFGVKKVAGVKVVEAGHSSSDDKNVGCVCAYYDDAKRVIIVNKQLWMLSTDYERFETIVHEFVHAYQHTYGLCSFDYKMKYNERPQELHAFVHTAEIMEDLHMKEVEVSFFEMDR